MSKVFISFRNGDEPFAAWLLYRALVERFGPEAVFRSSNSIPPGAEWAEEIWERHRASEVVIVVVGPRWLSIIDESGRRRLWQPGDWVREEVAEALRTGKHVIPVLAGTGRFTADQLPDDLAGLAARQAVTMDHRTGDAAIARILHEVQRRIGAPRERAAGRAPAGEGWLAAWNVPPRLPQFVERADLLSSLREDLVRAAASGPVVVHGGVGAGKTQLAIEYAYRFAGDYHLAWWVPGERPELLWTQLAALGQAVGFDLAAGVPDTLPALSRELCRRGRWLLIFDGAEEPGPLTAPLARLGAGADVLITSRRADWGQLPAGHRPVGEFDRRQSVRLLGSRLPGHGAAVLDRVADAVDDIPLAVAQAATFLAGSSLTADEYADLLHTRGRELLARGETFVYPHSLASAWSVGLQRLHESAADATDLLDLLAVLAPAPVPLDRLATWPPAAPAALADPIRRDDALRTVAGSGLVPVTAGRPRPHGLFQAFLRTPMAPERVAHLQEVARLALALAPRPEPREPAAWDVYAPLLPHLVVLDLVSSPDPACHRLLLETSAHLVARGDITTARDLAGAAARRWGERYGPDAQSTLEAISRLGQAQFRLREFRVALDLDGQVLARRRRLAGDDDPATLEAAHNVAMDTYAVAGPAAATPLLEDAVARRRRVLGDDHPDTLRSAHNLALVRRAAGDLAQARAQDEQTLHRLRGALGADHPDTLRSAHAFALDLRALGCADQRLAMDTYQRRRRVLGDDHPDTLQSAYGLAVDLRAAGAVARARDLAEPTYQRQRRVLGEEHADTRRTAQLLRRLGLSSPG